MRRNSGNIANRSAGHRCDRNFCWRGNAAGLGGFDVVMRWGINTVYAGNASLRSFFGLYDTSAGEPSKTSDPNVILNMIGVGSNSGDANLSLMHNDGSGTATMTGLGSSFPARGVDTVYELRLTCEPNAAAIDYSITNVCSAVTSTGSVSTDFPSSTTFLGWIEWMNTAATASAVGVFSMAISANSRY
jgi:hypothetical protein